MDFHNIYTLLKFVFLILYSCMSWLSSISLLCPTAHLSVIFIHTKQGEIMLKKNIKKAVRRGSLVPISPDRTQTKYEALLIILSKWSNQLPVTNDFANILAKDSLNPIKAWLLLVLFYIDIKLLSSLCKDLFTRLIYKISALLNIK